jgi:hypothetical protein
MYVVSFSAIFNENAAVLANRLGIQFIQNMSPKDNDIIIIFGAHDVADKLLAIKQSFKLEYIIIQTEQYNSRVFDNKYYIELLTNSVALDWSKLNMKRLKKNLPTPFYSVYFYDFFVPEITPEFDSRPIDFFFCGSASKEREKALLDFKFTNSEYNIEIDLSYSYTTPALLNEKLTQVKYVINLPYYRDNALETQRIHKALSMGCKVVSLLSADKELNEKYNDYVYFVPRLSDFSLLLEQPPKKTYLKLMEDFGIQQIRSNVEGIQYAEIKLKEKLKKNELQQNGNSSV